MFVLNLQGETNSIDVNNLEIMKKRVRPLKNQGEYESRRLWQHVTNALRAGDINTATEHKRFVSYIYNKREKYMYMNLRWKKYFVLIFFKIII